jgi:hypothetical protein
VLLVETPMPDRTMYMGQTKYSPRSSRLGVGRGANGLTSEKFTMKNPHMAVVPGKKKK